MTSSEPIGPDHDLARFNCGNADLDHWLRRSARHAEGMRTARTFVWARDSAVVGYYTLAAHAVPRASVPTNLGHGSPAVVPAYLLAKLALDHSYHGKGLGQVLLGDALQRCLVAGASAGARLVVVDAADNAAEAFYELCGFRHTLVPRRLARKLSDVAEDRAAGWSA